MSSTAFIQFAVLAALISAQYWLLYGTSSRWWGKIGPRDSTGDDSTEQKVAQKSIRPEINMLYGLHGNLTGFFKEWEVSLKSVLHNAPTDADLHVHVMCDDPACRSVQSVVHERLDLTRTLWRNRVRITAHEVEPYEQEWEAFLLRQTNGTKDNMDKRVTFGGLYRLFAHRVLPNVVHATYLDNEIIVLTNLNALLPEFNDAKIFQYGKSKCSGFMVLNLPKFDEFWRLLSELPNHGFLGDQHLIHWVATTFKNVTGQLSDQWNVDMSNYRTKPHDLHRRDSVSILHYNGIRSNEDYFWSKGLMHFCDRNVECKASNENREAFMRSWGLADYYIRLPWPWVKSMAAAQILPGEEGHSLEFHRSSPRLL